MNIFAIEKNKHGGIDWVMSARSQDNYRVVKMILESCQMLSTAINELSGTTDAPYRTTHKHHPSTKWVMQSSDNFCMLVVHCAEMLDEYERRFNKVHKCRAVLLRIQELFDPSLFPSNEPTRLPLAMPPEFHSDDIVESYRRFYASKPRMRYPADKVPSWFAEYRGDKEYQVV